MRLVQVSIPTGKRETVLSTLDDEGVDYVVADETTGRDYAAVAFFPLPANAVEPVLNGLREAGLDEDAFVVVLDAKTVISRRFEQLQERYAEEEDKDLIARQELTTAAAELAPGIRTYVIMTVVSALIATAGLLLNSPAVVVGSMVIAPLVGPAMAASVGTVVNDHDLFARGVRLQIGGLILSVFTAAVFAIMVRYARLIPPQMDITTVPQIRSRVAPDFLSLIVAVGAGVAGVVSLTSGVSTALVGVMIAVALIPPAATVGIGIAWNEPLVAIGSAVLLMVNVLSINLAALVVLWYSGYRPEHWFRQGMARNATIKRIVTLVVAIVVLSAFLGGITYDSYTRAATTTQLTEDAETIVNETNQSTDFRVTLLEARVEHSSSALFQEPERLIVVVGVPPGESMAGLAREIDARAEETAGRPIQTEVQYVTTETG